MPECPALPVAPHTHTSQPIEAYAASSCIALTCRAGGWGNWAQGASLHTSTRKVQSAVNPPHSRLPIVLTGACAPQKTIASPGRGIMAMDGECVTRGDPGRASWASALCSLANVCLREAQAHPHLVPCARAESNATCGKRLDSIGVENTEDNRKAYRELLVSAPGLGQVRQGGAAAANCNELCANVHAGDAGPALPCPPFSLCPCVLTKFVLTSPSFPLPHRPRSTSPVPSCSRRLCTRPAATARR